MRIFLSAGEPSGDLHGSNLARALRRRESTCELVGFGGDRMAAAGVDLLYPLSKHAVMGIVNVLKNINTFRRILLQGETFFRKQRPDALVVIDFPGFHWELIKRAHRYRVPVYYFVPPQIWAWGTWRVAKMRRWAKHVLAALPFEADWFRERGCSATFIGHPYFDELARRTLDPAFLAAEQADGREIIALLPGSRKHEVEDNFPDILRTAGRIHAARPTTRFLVASFNDAQAERARACLAEANVPKLPIAIHVGRTPEIIRLARCCVAVSGSVSLELMHAEKPATIVYRIGWAARLFVRNVLMQVPYITLVNLLAKEEIYPEYLTSRDESAAMATHVLRWLQDQAVYAGTVEKLRAVKAAVAQPGACERAADFLLAELGRTNARPLAANDSA